MHVESTVALRRLARTSAQTQSRVLGFPKGEGERKKLGKKEGRISPSHRR